jgi:hypothetical protein
MEISKKKKPGGSRHEPTAPSPKMEIAKKSEFLLPAANLSRQPTAESRQRERKKEKKALTRQAAVERANLLHPALGGGRQLRRLGGHLLLKRKPLPLNLSQPLAQVIHLLLLSRPEEGKHLEVVLLKPAQPRQLPISHLELGGSRPARLLALVH